MDDDKPSKQAAQTPQAKGGDARAKALPPERRSEIGRIGAIARWDAEIPQATHEGDLTIGRATLRAAVLPNGKRLLSQGTFLKALGRSRSPKAGTGALSTVDGLPTFLQAEQLKPFISDELRVSTTPIFFRTGSGRKTMGYDAELLPMVCEVYLRLRDESLAQTGKAPSQYKHIIEQCDALMRGLAHVGIIALVDEATGYQEIRDRLALQAILERYLRKELAAWAKRFPDEFYQEIFRLRGWQWKGMKVNRPQIVSHYTKDIVYARLAPQILQELEARNPVTEKGYRRVKHHQWLTEDVGHPALAQHLYSVITLMRVSDDWTAFKRLIDRAHPRYGESLILPFMADPDSSAP